MRRPDPAARDTLAIVTVLACAMLWGFWWAPVSLLQGAGVDGAWIGVAMTASVLPVAIGWSLVRPGGLSARAVGGAIVVGAAITLYAISVSYTDFIRAVLLFYFAPAWSTIIECTFMGRRWTWKSGLAIVLAFGGIVLISRGEISFDGLGAMGDWMALASGLLWSIGVAMIFSARRVELSRMLLVTALGGIAVALGVAGIEGSLGTQIAAPLAVVTAAPWVFVATSLYMGVLLTGTMWGAFRLPPMVMTYLLSVEILSGVLSSALLLGEPFGLFEAAGAALITAAVLTEVVGSRPASQPRPDH